MADVDRTGAKLAKLDQVWAYLKQTWFLLPGLSSNNDPRKPWSVTYTDLEMFTTVDIRVVNNHMVRTKVFKFRLIFIDEFVCKIDSGETVWIEVNIYCSNDTGYMRAGLEIYKWSHVDKKQRASVRELSDVWITEVRGKPGFL